MKKTYVLDTSVLLYSASSLRSFGSKDVVIPYVVLEELDTFKSRDDIVGSNARQVARELNELRRQGPINEGVVVTPKGGKLRVELNFHESINGALDIKKNDDRILNVCLGLKDRCPKLILVTKDVNLAVRADVLGIEAQDFDADLTVSSVDEMYTGTGVLVVPDEVIEAFYSGEDIFCDDVGQCFFPNQYLTLSSEVDTGKTALVRVFNNKLVRLHRPKSIWGVQARNREQQFAIDALLNTDVTLVSLTGTAGVGKTLIALACALQQVQEEAVYNRLAVSRPIQPLGKDIGYLPGNLQEKLSPWMGPIKDSLDYLMRDKGKKRNMYEEMVEMGMLEIEPLTYIRGRSMPNTIFLFDESQDLSRPEIKTIVSRMGENSKLVLIGDVMQMSNPYLNSMNNGLSNVVEKFKPYDFAAHVTLTKGERSTLATIASEIL
jgi:PhoH-like ATPase